MDVTEFDPKVYEVDKISIKCPRDPKWLWWIFDSTVCWFLLKLNGYFGVTWSGMFNESFQLSYLSSFCSLSSSHRWRWMQCIWWLPQWQRIPPLRLLCPRPSWTSFLKKLRGTITGSWVFSFGAWIEHVHILFLGLGIKNTSTSPLKDWHIQCQFFREFGESDKFFYWISVSSGNMQCQRPTSAQSHLGTCAGFGGNPKHSKATWYQQASNRVHLHYIPIYFIICLIRFHDYFIIFHYESLEFVGHQTKTQDALSSFQWIHRNPLFGGSMDAFLGWSIPNRAGSRAGGLWQLWHRGFLDLSKLKAIIYKIWLVATQLFLYIVIFTPTWGFMIQFDEDFSNGL